MDIFFYGLFMDVSLLEEKGISPTRVMEGFLDDFALHIGERATLTKTAGARTYGVMMRVAQSDIARLYSEDSVADYLPENVTVTLPNGDKASAICYNLPAGKISGSNRDYARSLLKVATRLGFPEPYLARIRGAN